MIRSTLLPLQGGNNKPIRSPRALPWADGSLALRVVLILALFLCAITPVKAQSPKDFTARVALNGGWTMKTGKTPNDNPAYYKDYLESVKQGWSLGANAQFCIYNWFSLGAYYDYFKKSSYLILSYTQTEQNVTQEINNTYTIDFLALSLGIQKSDDKNRYMLHYLIGFMDYKEVGNYSPYYAWVSNYTVGYCLGHGVMMSYDHMVNKHLAIGAELTYCIGSIKELNHQGHLGDPNNLITGTSQLDDPIKLHRLSPKVGLRYYF